MDSMARGLRIAAKIISEGVLAKNVKARYSSFESGIGAKIASGEASLEDCEKYVEEKGEPPLLSGQQEHYENMLPYHVRYGTKTTDLSFQARSNQLRKKTLRKR